MRIAEIAFRSLFDDTKQLVADGVRNDVAIQITQAKSDEKRRAAESRGKEREKFLKKWLSLDCPLAYGRHDAHETFQALVMAVVSDPSHISHGLPNLHDHAMTRPVFVEKLLAMSSPLNRSAPCAPIMRDGSFLPLLVEAHQNLISLSQETDEKAQSTFVQKFFLRTIEYLRICFVPSHIPRTGAPGAPHRKPVFTSWAHLGLRDDRPLRALPQTRLLTPTSQSFAEMALGDALANDSNADWLSNGLTIDALHTILNKTRLPQDYSPPTPANELYVDQTYAWVRDAYDGRRPSHHLALIVAIIASSFLPNLFMPKDVSKLPFISATSPDQVRDIYNNIDWVERRTRGMSDRSIFISMITTFIIGLYEPGSPLRQHMASLPKAGLGNPWTQKHCGF
jgi:hypothetical protein